MYKEYALVFKSGFITAIQNLFDYHFTKLRCNAKYNLIIKKNLVYTRQLTKFQVTPSVL